MILSAKLVREARTAADMTQSELAKQAGTSQPTIAAYEAGSKVPTVATLERVLRAAGASLSASRSKSYHGKKPLRGMLHKHRQEIREVAAKHHAGNVRVFGSVARGGETDRSDVDFLVEMEPGTSLLDQVRLQRALSDLLGVPVDVITSSGLRESDHQTILEEAVPI